MARGQVEQLIYAAVSLSQAAPKEWDEFLKALGVYSVDLNRRLLNSDGTMLANAQGQAVQADYLLTTLANARHTVQNAEIKRRALKT